MSIEELHKRFLESDGVSTDTRSITHGQMFFALKGENFNGNLYADLAIESGASYAIIDEAQDSNNPAYILVDDVLKTLQDLAKYHRHFCNAKVIGITGSNGKTTTKELLYSVMSTTFDTQATIGNLNNHIGVPLTLLKLNTQTEISIVEMGANRPGDIQELCEIAEPDFGYITNIGEAHLEGLGNLEGVYETKTALFRSIMSSGTACFVNQYDSYLSESTIPSEKLTYLNDRIKLLEGSSSYLQVDYDDTTIQTQLTGDYNIDNVRAAITIGEHLGVGVADIVEAIESYHPTNQRSQIIQYDNYRIILDAYNANPTSMKVSLKNAKGQSNEEEYCIAIIGDMLELGDYAHSRHQEIISYAIDLGFDELILVGNLMSNAYESMTSELEQVDKKITAYANVDQVKPYYDQLNKQGSILFFKASRGIKLERLLA